MADEKKKRSESLFQVHFRDPKENKIVSLKARKVGDSTLGLSFISISDFLFETHGVVVKPSEEQMAKRLEGVKSLHISLYSVISIEELSETSLTFQKDKSNLLVLPTNDNPSPN